MITLGQLININRTAFVVNTFHMEGIWDINRVFFTILEHKFYWHALTNTKFNKHTQIPCTGQKESSFPQFIISALLETVSK